MSSAPGEPVSIELRVRYAETDQMGVVYHSNYLVWCEVARTELIRRRGPSYAELERAGVYLAVAELTVRYHAPARYDDRIRVDTWVTSLRSRTVTFAYRVVRIAANGDDERLATAETVLVALDAHSRPRTLPPELMETLSDA